MLATAWLLVYIPLVQQVANLHVVIDLSGWQLVSSETAGFTDGRIGHERNETH